MNFLETGKRPEFAEDSKTRAGKTKKAVNPQADHWPFPAPPRANDSNSRLDHGHAQNGNRFHVVLYRIGLRRLGLRKLHAACQETVRMHRRYMA